VQAFRDVARHGERRRVGVVDVGDAAVLGSLGRRPNSLGLDPVVTMQLPRAVNRAATPSTAIGTSMRITEG
jgi:hypothetical protein